jgi:LAO/AO transport system kinase
VVVLVPESGDGIQVMKAGVFELADIFVVNKSDRPGAEELLAQLKDLPPRPGHKWHPPVVGTCALKGEGIDELDAAIDRHRAFITEQGSPGSKDREFWFQRFLRLAEREVVRDLQQELTGSEPLAAQLEAVLAKRKSLSRLLSETLARFYRNRLP